jgi:hypothetical protein
MTSTDARKPNSSRRLLWIAALLIVLFGLYSAGWFYLADRLRTKVDETVASLNARGIEASCANMQISGYPLRFALTCDNLAYEDDAGNVAASAGSLVAAASIVRPLTPTAELQGPLRTSVPSMAPLWLDWDHLSAAIGLSWPAPSGISIKTEGLSAQTDPADDSDPVQLFSATTAQAELSPDGQDIDYSGWFNGLQVDAEAIDGRILPPLDGSGRARLKNGIALLGQEIRSLRGQSVEIGKFDLSSGKAHITVSGPISVDADGLIDADLKIKLVNPKAVSAILAKAIPEHESEIEQGFGALAIFGSEPSMPLKIVKGKASLGFIPLGRIKAVE